MSDHAIAEEPVQFGEGGRLFGILTLPAVEEPDFPKSPVFVFLNAGLLHRTGPHRMHVRVARDLAQSGLRSFRVDLAGLGDSLPRSGLTYVESVEADFAEIMTTLEARLGPAPAVLVGLCAGADNAIRFVPRHPRVVGMVLLDPVCEKDDGFAKRARWFKWKIWRKNLLNPTRYAARLQRLFGPSSKQGGSSKESTDKLSLRALPTGEETRNAFRTIRDRKGRVLVICTSYALPYYNESGQMGRVLGIDGFEEFCREVFWPKVAHTYQFEPHRRRVIDEIKSWATAWKDSGKHFNEEYQ